MEKLANSNKNKWISFPEISYQERSQIIESLNNADLKNKRSHYFNGRWENIYIPINLIPNLKKVLSQASQMGKKIIKETVIVPRKDLGYHLDEYWFNIAKPGEFTGWHDHKKGAMLSGVYYLDVPNNGGNIRFKNRLINKKYKWEIKSKTGQMILFPASQKHAVDINKSSRNRISIGFNLFTLPIKVEKEQSGYSSSKYYG